MDTTERRNTRSAKVDSAKKTGVTRWVVLFGLIIIFVLIFAIFWMIVIERVIDREEMSRYLKDKYGREFVIENIRAEGAGLGVKGSVCADVSVKNSDIKSKLCKSQVTGDYNNDTYPQEVWSKQDYDKTKKFLEGNVKGVDLYRVTVRVNTEDSLYQTLRGDLPSFEYIKDKSNDFGYVLSVFVTKGNIDSSIYDDIYKLVQYVRNKNSVNPEIYFNYRDADFGNKHPGDQYQYFISIDKNRLNKITSPNDIVQYVEEIK